MLSISLSTLSLTKQLTDDSETTESLTSVQYPTHPQIFRTGYFCRDQHIASLTANREILFLLFGFLVFMIADVELYNPSTGVHSKFGLIPYILFVSFFYFGVLKGKIESFKNMGNTVRKQFQLIESTNRIQTK